MNRLKKIAMHDYDDCTVVFVPDHPTRHGCLDCRLSRDVCNSLCLLEGTRYHVAEVHRYGRLRTWWRYMKRTLFLHY